MSWVLLVLLGAELTEAKQVEAGVFSAATCAELLPSSDAQLEPGVFASPGIESAPTADVAAKHGPLNTIGLASSTVVLLAASTGAALTAGVALHGAPFAANGRPNTLVTNFAMVVTLGVQFAVAHLLVPTVATWWRPEQDVARVREKAWEWSRWPLAAGAVGTLTYTVGALLEESRWGRGDGVMATGLIVTILSLLVFDVFEGLATWGAVR